MITLLKLLVVIFFIFLCQFIFRRHDKKQIELLTDNFLYWIKCPSEKTRPNNKLFVELFRPIYGDKHVHHPLPDNKRATTISNYYSLIDSFPTMSTSQAIEDQITLLQNMNDYYQYRYNEIFSVQYWFKFVVYLPKNILIYLGANPDTVIGKIANFIYWLFIVTWSIFKTQIINIIKQLFF
ncbi:hypothetical protein B8A39_06565 [Dolosigranulum pigrum]|uniref:hypothetical protein n=1 Tax=Dolosigranulum pigrum TaxID=29394 RepID=UPI000DBF7131|nr:hypothetical protein [Dolosigranulum pigrum]QTJ57565.1 hypothetical protein FE335_08885 [Dolosigranulum pigrum]RAN51500.1 hypothetical protein B8A39_06565 [Dolosigranulum pigrum]